MYVDRLSKVIKYASIWRLSLVSFTHAPDKSMDGLMVGGWVSVI